MSVLTDIPIYSHDTVVTAGDITMEPSDGQVFMYDAQSPNKWTISDVIIDPLVEAIKEMEVFKEFLIMKGVISNDEFERYKEDRAKIENIK